MLDDAVPHGVGDLLAEGLAVDGEGDLGAGCAIEGGHCEGEFHLREVLLSFFQQQVAVQEAGFGSGGPFADAGEEEHPVPLAEGEPEAGDGELRFVLRGVGVEGGSGLRMVEGGEGVKGIEHSREGKVDEALVADLVGIGVIGAHFLQGSDEAFDVFVALVGIGECCGFLR